MMKQLDKKTLSERDICSKFILPTILAAGWDGQSQVREEVAFTKGRVHVRGKTVKRGEPKRADFVLYHQPNLPIAVIEVKDNHHGVGDGMQQAIGYAEPKALDVPFAFSSNGDRFLVHDFTGTYPQVEFELPLDQFPSPSELWGRYCQWKGIGPADEPIVTQHFYDDGSGKSPRYYQLNATSTARKSRIASTTSATSTARSCLTSGPSLSPARCSAARKNS